MSLIVVGGAQRTGTSLMQNLLCQAEGTNPYIREASYLRHLVQLYVANRDPKGNGLDYFDDPVDTSRFHGQLAQAFIERTKERYGCETLVLKEPALTPLWPYLFEMLPDTHFVCMMRDPRDAALSLWEVQQRLGSQKPFDWAAAATQFNATYVPLLVQQEPTFRGRICWIKYEDLVAEPATVLEGLAERLQLAIPDSAATDDIGRGRIDDHADDRFLNAWVTPRFGQKVDASGIGRHRDLLPDGAATTIAEVTGRFLRTFNYPNAPAWTAEGVALTQSPETRS